MHYQLKFSRLYWLLFWGVDWFQAKDPIGTSGKSAMFYWKRGERFRANKCICDLDTNCLRFWHISMQNHRPQYTGSEHLQTNTFRIFYHRRKNVAIKTSQIFSILTTYFRLPFASIQFIHHSLGNISFCYHLPGNVKSAYNAVVHYLLIAQDSAFNRETEYGIIPMIRIIFSHAYQP